MLSYKFNFKNSSKNPLLRKRPKKIAKIGEKSPKLATLSVGQLLRISQ
jgi:hypothetical protein